MNPLIKCAHTEEGSEPINTTDCKSKRNEDWSVQASSFVSRWLMAVRPQQIWHKLRNTPERKNSLDSPATLSRKSREERFY